MRAGYYRSLLEPEISIFVVFFKRGKACIQLHKQLNENCTTNSNGKIKIDDSGSIKL